MAAAEGTRMSKLRDAVNKTLDGALGSVSRDDFLACFPELVHTHEAVLTELYQQLVASVRPNVLQEFEKICEEHNIAARLNELDHASGSVAELQDQVAQVAPEDQMREVRMKIKARERDELQALLQKSEQECAEVQKRLDGHRSQVALMEKSINGATQHLEKAAMAAHKWLEQPDPVH